MHRCYRWKSINKPFTGTFCTDAWSHLYLLSFMYNAVVCDKFPNETSQPFFIHQKRILNKRTNHERIKLVWTQDHKDLFQFGNSCIIKYTCCCQAKSLQIKQMFCMIKIKTLSIVCFIEAGFFWKWFLQIVMFSLAFNIQLQESSHDSL